MGVHYLLNQLRKKYFILKAYSAVKSIVNQCIHCKRFNSKSIQVNTNQYCEFMVNSKERMFGTLFIDYIGAFTTLINKEKTKTSHFIQMFLEQGYQHSCSNINGHKRFFKCLSKSLLFFQTSSQILIGIHLY